MSISKIRLQPWPQTLFYLYMFKTTPVEVLKFCKNKASNSITNKKGIGMMRSIVAPPKIARYI